MMQNPQMMAMAQAMMQDPEIMQLMQQPGVSLDDEVHCKWNERLRQVHELNAPSCASLLFVRACFCLAVSLVSLSPCC